MAYEYRVKDQNGMYFITCTVNQWIDVFTRKQYIDLVLESLLFCQKTKGLKIYGWVIMSNHIHLILSSDVTKLSDIIRDFKKFTSSSIFRLISTNEKESRKNWLLWLLKKDEKIMFWQEGYHGEVIQTKDFFYSKLNYIHQNPVRSGLVEKAEDYLHSSAGDYVGLRKSVLEITYI